MAFMISFLLIVCIFMVLVMMVVAHGVQRLVQAFNSPHIGNGQKRGAQFSKLDLYSGELGFTPGSYRDVQLDELLAADRYREAQTILTERMRQAVEQGDDRQVMFYRDYQRRIDRGAA